MTSPITSTDVYNRLNNLFDNSSYYVSSAYWDLLDRCTKDEHRMRDTSLELLHKVGLINENGDITAAVYQVMLKIHAQS